MNLMNLMKHKLLITGAAVVILGGAVAGSVLLARGSAAGQPAANPALPPATAEVTRTTLVETRTVAGTLGYGDPAPISATGAGTLTWIAPVESTVTHGEPLFKVDERPVVALYGAVPLYRTLSDGAEGPDVQQLEENLFELGYTGYTTVTIDVLVNDLGRDLNVSAVTNPSNGTAVVNADDTITYTPNPGFVGVDTFNYTATDANDQSASALVTVVVIPAPPPPPTEGPTANPDVATTPRDRRVIVDALVNDLGEDLNVSAVTNPSNGTAVVNADDTITYTPNPGFVGVDTFDYTATDANDQSASALVTVVVTAASPPPTEGPTANPDVATTPQDTPDATYTSTTAAAVRAWQADLGLPEAGTVEPGQVVFIPGAVRIAEHTARVGDAIGGAPVLSYTGTARLVTVDLNVRDRALAVEGRKVTITVPGGRAVEGEISLVGAVVRDDTIEVTVTIADPEALGALDAAPVDVDFVSEERQDVLAVPVAALLALAKGGYGVELVEGDTTRIVTVTTGMFAAGRVEIGGEEIAEGMLVGVPR